MIAVSKKKEDCATPGEFMRYHREAQGLSIYALSKRSGISMPTIEKWERNESSPVLRGLEIVADTLGISIDEYVGHKVKNAASPPTKV